MKWILVLVFVSSCLGVCTYAVKKSGDKKSAEAAEFDKQDAISVTPKDLAAAYKENEVAADQKYKGKKIEIAGEVASIDSGLGDEPIVHLRSGELIGVALDDISKDEAATLKKGQKITAVCKGAGEVIGVPRLSDCKLK